MQMQINTVISQNENAESFATSTTSGGGKISLSSGISHLLGPRFMLSFPITIRRTLMDGIGQREEASEGTIGVSVPTKSSLMTKNKKAKERVKWLVAFLKTALRKRSTKLGPDATLQGKRRTRSKRANSHSYIYTIIASLQFTVYTAIAITNPFPHSLH